MIQEEREARDLRVGLAGHGDIVIREAVHLAGHFLGPDDHEKFPARPDLADDIGQVDPVHREVDNFPPGSLPVPDAGAPPDIILAEEVPAPPVRYVKDTLHDAFVARGKKHPRSPERPPGQGDMGGHPLVAFRTVADPEYCHFFSCHVSFSLLL